ncbi:hypothetical protein ACI68E_001810 [Malassezia pachydermatis]
MATQGPSLKAFLLQAKALALYRSFIRSTRSIPTMEARWETMHWFRTEIERLRNETDPLRMESQLTHSRIVMKQISGAFMLSSGDSTQPPLRGLRRS